MPPNKPPPKPSPKSQQDAKGKGVAQSSSLQGHKKQDQQRSHNTSKESVSLPDVHDTHMMGDNIEADAEIEVEDDFDVLVGDDDFIITDSTDFQQDSADQQKAATGKQSQEATKDKFVIPKQKYPESESSHSKGRQDSDDARLDQDRSRNDKTEKNDSRRYDREKEELSLRKGPQNGQPIKGILKNKDEAKPIPKEMQEGLKSFIDGFNLKKGPNKAAESESEKGKEKGSEAESNEKAKKEASQQSGVTEIDLTADDSATEDLEQDKEMMEEEPEIPLEIPEGRDSIASLRGRFPWQIRIFPVNQADVTRSEFAPIWGMADSSSIVWSTVKGVGGVAEFLLHQRESIQKFMRKAMFHACSSHLITIEIIERGAGDSKDDAKKQEEIKEKESPVISRAIFRYDNHRAKQLIKTFYPTAKGEVTERSLYVNNVGPGVSTDIMKAIFPCALKIGVAKASKDASLALVETESAEAAFNYLVVYEKIHINGLDLLLTTTEYDWQSARNKYDQKHGNKKRPSKTQQGPSKTPVLGAKRPSSATTTPSSQPPAKKERTSSPGASKEQGENRGAVHGSSVGAGHGSSVGAGRGSSIGAGRGSSVGAGRGSSVGAGRGSSVGADRGSSVGAGRGSSVGAGRGSSVGAGRGSSVGASSGSSIGASVGGRGTSRGGPGAPKGGPGQGGPGGPKGSPGAPRGGAAVRGRGRGRGQGLLPDPLHSGSSEGLLPRPKTMPPSLLSMPTMPPASSIGPEADFLMAQEEHQRRTAELKEVRQQLESQVLETRASLVMAARRAEAQAVAKLQSRLSLLDSVNAGLSGRSGGAGDYYNEDEPQGSRRTLLRHDESEADDWAMGQDDYSGPQQSAASHDYEEDYANVHPRGSAPQRTRPYLLKAPMEKSSPGRSRTNQDQFGGSSLAETFDYRQARGRSHGSGYDMGGRGGQYEQGRPALHRRGGGLLESPRRGFMDDTRIPKGQESYEYDNREGGPRGGFAPGRRPPYEGDDRRGGGRYAEHDAGGYGYDQGY